MEAAAAEVRPQGSPAPVFGHSRGQAGINASCGWVKRKAKPVTRSRRHGFRRKRSKRRAEQRCAFRLDLWVDARGQGVAVSRPPLRRCDFTAVRRFVAAHSDRPSSRRMRPVRGVRAPWPSPSRRGGKGGGRVEIAKVRVSRNVAIVADRVLPVPPPPNAALPRRVMTGDRGSPIGSDVANPVLIARHRPGKSATSCGNVPKVAHSSACGRGMWSGRTTRASMRKGARRALGEPNRAARRYSPPTGSSANQAGLR